MRNLRTSCSLLFLASCSSPAAGVAVDAPGADAPHVQFDGPPGSGSDTVTDVQCASSVFTQVLPTGKIITTTLHAELAVDPSSIYTVEYCDEATNNVPVLGNGGPPACPSGSTCTTSGAPYPTWQHGCVINNALFLVDGNVLIGCGSTTANFDAGGTMTSETTTSYGAIKLHVH